MPRNNNKRKKNQNRKKAKPGKGANDAHISESNEVKDIRQTDDGEPVVSNVVEQEEKHAEAGRSCEYGGVTTDSGDITDSVASEQNSSE